MFPIEAVLVVDMAVEGGVDEDKGNAMQTGWRGFMQLLLCVEKIDEGSILINSLRAKALGIFTIILPNHPTESVMEAI